MKRRRGRFESWCQAGWLCPSDERETLVKWHKWLPARSSITANKYIWENCQTSGEFLETRFELIGSAHTDGSPVYSNCLCSVNNTLHTTPLASEGLNEWCHPLWMCICVFDCAYISPIAPLFASYMNRRLVLGAVNSHAILRRRRVTPFKEHHRCTFYDNVWLKHCVWATVCVLSQCDHRTQRYKLIYWTGTLFYNHQHIHHSNY